MPARRYRFHCTNGHELVTDLEGRTCQSAMQVRRHADRVALALMESVEWSDWARWQVSGGAGRMAAAVEAMLP